MTNLHTDAWLLRGISSIPGELRLADGVLSFVAHGVGSAWPFQLRKLERLLAQPALCTTLEELRPCLLFSWPAREVSFALPWYYFGGGIDLRNRDIQLRFSFGAPAGTGRSLGAAEAELRKLGPMRARGRLWAAALAACRT